MEALHTLAPIVSATSFTAPLHAELNNSTRFTVDKDTDPPLTEDDAIEITVAPQCTIFHPLKDATIDDVMLTATAQTPVAGNRKSQLMWLKEINGSTIKK